MGPFCGTRDLTVELWARTFKLGLVLRTLTIDSICLTSLEMITGSTMADTTSPNVLLSEEVCARWLRTIVLRQNFPFSRGDRPLVVLQRPLNLGNTCTDIDAREPVES